MKEKIESDDPVSKYLPIFDKYMKSYVTIRQCLAHTTGIENDKGIVEDRTAQQIPERWKKK